MFRIESWSADNGWREHYRSPQTALEAKVMVEELRRTHPERPWRVVQVLNF